DTNAARPEAALNLRYFPIRVAQVNWTYTASSRWLFEAGYSNLYDIGQGQMTDPTNATTRAITDQATGYQYGARYAGLGLTDYTIPPYNNTSNRNARFTMSYVTGTHSAKVGLSTLAGQQTINVALPFAEAYTFRGTTPAAL